jgi:hypothetical protein
MPETNLTDEQYRSLARDKYQSEGKIEIDEDAEVSRGEDAGAYVQAWVWVADEDQKDLRFVNGGSVVTLYALSDAGREWVAENVPTEPWQGDARTGIVIEPRMAGDIMEGAEDNGLRVELK